MCIVSVLCPVAGLGALGETCTCVSVSCFALSGAGMHPGCVDYVCSCSTSKTTCFKPGRWKWETMPYLDRSTSVCYSFISILVTCAEERESLFAELLLCVRQAVWCPLRSLSWSCSHLEEGDSTILISQMTRLRLSEINLKQLANFQLGFESKSDTTAQHLSIEVAKLAQQ